MLDVTSEVLLHLNGVIAVQIDLIPVPVDSEAMSLHRARPFRRPIHVVNQQFNPGHDRTFLSTTDTDP